MTTSSHPPALNTFLKNPLNPDLNTHSLLPLLGSIFQVLTTRCSQQWKLQPNACLVLRNLYVEPEVAEPAEIARAIHLPRQTTTFILDALEKQGLARRKPHPSDRRRKIVEITPKGKVRAQEIRNDLVQVETHALAGFSRKEAQTVRTLLYRYAAAISQQQDSPTES